MTRREEIARELDNRIKNKRKNEISSELDRRLAEREKKQQEKQRQADVARGFIAMSQMTGGGANVTSRAPSPTGTTTAYSPLMVKAGQSQGIDYASRDKAADDVAFDVAVSKLRSQLDAEAKAKEEKEAAEREAVINYDTEAGKQRVADYENKLTDLYKRQNEVDEKIASAGGGKTVNGNTSVTTLPDERKALLNEKISMKLKDTEKGIFDDLTAEKEMLKKAEKSVDRMVHQATSAPDFAEKSGYVSTKYDPVADKNDLLYNNELGMGYRDLTYEYINDQNGVRDEILGHVNDGGRAYSDYGYEYMTPEQVSIYNYYYNTQGPESANKYLSFIADDLTTALAGERVKSFDDTWKEPFYIADASAKKAVTNMTQGFYNFLTDSEDPIVRSADYKATRLGKENDTGFRKLFNDLVDTTANQLPSIGASILANAVLPGSGVAVANATMWASNAGASYDEMIGLGYTPSQASAYAVLTATSETALQRIMGGISAFGGGVIDDLIPGVNKAISKLAKNHPNLAIFANAGKEAGKEALEEAVQSVLEPMFKAAATGEDFEGVDVSEVLYSALLGALSSFGLEGAPNIAVNTPGMVRNAIVGAVNKRAAKDKMPSFINGVKQKDIDDYVDAAYINSNDQDYKKYANVSDRLIEDVGGEIDIRGYTHALRDNDIRHIRNSHGEQTNEKYPVTKDDIKHIPDIIENYDKVFVSQKGNKTGIVYVKVSSEGLVYYLEQVTTKYGNENLLINKQMIKTGIGDIPDISSIKTAITKKQTVTEFLNDLKEVQQVYVQDVYQSQSADTIIPQSPEIVKGVDNKKLTEGLSTMAVEAMKDGITTVSEDKAADFAVDFRAAYQAGMLGVPLDSATETVVMTDSQRKAAYDMGVADAKAEALKESAFDADIDVENKADVTSRADIDVEPQTALETKAEQKSVIDKTSVDMFEDSEGILTDEELEAMHGFEREAAKAPANAVTDGDITITGSKSISPEELERRTALAAKAKTDTAKSGIMEGVSEKNIKQAEFLSKVFGRKVLFYSDSYRVNGKTKDGIIYVNAKKGSITSQILAHELTHTAEVAKQYGQLYTAVKKLYIAEGLNWDTELDSLLNDETYIEQYKSEGREFTKTDAEHELVARKIEEIIGDEAKLTQFVKDNRNWATRALAWIRNKIRGFADSKLNADEFEVLQLMRDVEKKLAKALRDTKGVSIEKGKAVEYDAEARAVKKKGKSSDAEAKTETGSEYAMDSDSKSAQGDITAAYQKTVDAIINGTHKGNSAVLLGYTPQIFEELGAPSLPFVIGVGHVYSIAVSEAKAKSEKRYSSKFNYHDMGVSTVKDLYNLIQDPIMVIASKDVDKNKTPMRSTHSVVAIVDVGKQNKQLLMPVEITATRTVSGTEMDVNVLSSSYLKKTVELIKEAIAQENSGDKGVFYIKNGVTHIDDSGVQFPIHLNNKRTPNGILHDISEKINMGVDDVTKSLQFAKWFGDWQNHPDEASKVVNADGTPKEMYHGTNEEFTVFDRTKGKKKVHLNVLGDGNYFTARKEGAEHYGERVVDAYLSIKNPYIFKSKEYTTVADQIADEYGINRDSFKGSDVQNFLKGKNFDGVLLLDADGEVIIANAFDSTQIKSATDNIGTFDKSNPDIRYSLATDEQLRKQAIKMLQDGISAKQVYEETGFFIDDKGRIRNDIDDVDSKDPAIRKPYPVENVGKIKTEAREKLEAEREQHKKELAYNRQYWQAETRKAKEDVRHEYALRDAKRTARRDEAKAKKRAEKERRKRARGGYISIEKIRAALENNTFVKEMEKLWDELRALEKAAEVYNTVNIEEASPELQEEIRELRNKVEDKRVYINKVGQQKRKVMRMKALEMLRSGNIELWKDKKTLGGFRYSVNTMLRNIEDISNGDELGKAVYKEYFAPIQKHVAEATKLKNDIRTRVADLGLSTEVRKGDVLSESAFVQLLGEARDNVYALEHNVGYSGRYNGNKTRNGRTFAEWQDIVTTLMVENPSISKNPEAMKRVDNAIDTFKAIYDDLFKSLNKVRIYNGYAPIEYRRGYFPHFSSETSVDSVWSELCDGLNFKIDTEDLPTTINGLTSRFKPGMQYQTFDKARSDHVGEEYNNIRLEGMGAVEGIDRYIEVAANVIYLTEDIQKLRALSEMIRYNSDKDGGVKDHIDNTRKRTDISEDEKQILIDAYLATNPEKSLSNFVVHLEEYTNLLAGKKSFYDRAMEQLFGRGAYTVAKKIESRVAANMVALNPGSWLTNFIPLTQAAPVVGNARMLLAASQTVQAGKNDDGFVARSSFLTNRRGSDRLVKGKLRAVSDVLGSPMSWIDNFTAETIVRARYNQNIADNMSPTEAMEDADTFAANVMGDRSLGTTPTLFNQNNPVTKLFTQYQLEVNNQIGYVFKNLPRMYEKDKRKLAAALVKMAVYGFLYNFIYKGLTGRDAAADPIGVLNDVSGDVFGVSLPDMRDFFIKGFTPELFQTENYGQWKDVKGWQDAAWKTLEVSVNALGTVSSGIAEELPFTSVLGLVLEDFDQGRIPITSAVPNLVGTGKAIGEFAEAMKTSAAAGTQSGAYKRFVRDLYNEFVSPLSYTLMPFGAGQVKKVVGTAEALVKGGSYTYDAEGNRQLQYPLYTDEGLRTVSNAAQGLLFGKTSTETGNEWVDSGFGTLSAKKTVRYEQMVASGVSQRDAWEAVNASADDLYKVAVSGDRDKLNIYRRAYESDSDYKSALRKGLLNNDPRIAEAIEANINGDIATRTKIYKEIVGEGCFDLGIVTATVNNATTSFNSAVRAAATAKAVGNDAEYNKQIKKLVGEQGYSKKLVSEKLGAEVITEEETAEDNDEAYSLYSASDIGTALDSGDGKLAKEIIADLIDTKVKNGADEKKARSSVKSSVTSYYKELYLAAYDSNDYREKNRILDALLQSGLYGKNRTEVKETLESWEKAHKEK